MRKSLALAVPLLLAPNVAAQSAAPMTAAGDGPGALSHFRPGAQGLHRHGTQHGPADARHHIHRDVAGSAVDDLPGDVDREVGHVPHRQRPGHRSGAEHAPHAPAIPAASWLQARCWTDPGAGLGGIGPCSLAIWDRSNCCIHRLPPWASGPFRRAIDLGFRRLCAADA